MKTLIAALIFSFSSVQCFACSCIGWEGQYVLDRYRTASGVILGIPTSDSTFHSSTRTRGNYTKTLLKADIKVVKSFKNDLPEELTILSEKPDGANCGVQFTEARNTYLIFLTNTNKGYLETNICTTAVLAPANRDITQAILQLMAIE